MSNVEYGETENGLLPSDDRIRNMDIRELLALHQLVKDWEGPKVEKFRMMVEDRLK